MGKTQEANEGEQMGKDRAMEKGRCKTCKWWGDEPVEDPKGYPPRQLNCRECNRIPSSLQTKHEHEYYADAAVPGSAVMSYEVDMLITGPEFYCALWEPEEESDPEMHRVVMVTAVNPGKFQVLSMRLVAYDGSKCSICDEHLRADPAVVIVMEPNSLYLCIRCFSKLTQNIGKAVDALMEADDVPCHRGGD